MLLKPNMVLSGLRRRGRRRPSPRSPSARCAASGGTVPAAVPGIVFLSGGQTDEHATAHLDAMNKRGPHPWQLTFSYGRALQAPALKAWKGDAANVDAGKAAFLHRARLNGAARSGALHARHGDGSRRPGRAGPPVPQRVRACANL